MGAVGGIPEPARAAEVKVGEMKIGSIDLQVMPGDITKEGTDAIVNGTNPDLDMSQGTVCHFI